MSATTPSDHASTIVRLTELLRQRSLTHGDFVLASGRRSTFYIDARQTTMSGEGQVLIGAAGLAALQSRSWRPRSVGGLTLGADPVAYAIAHAARLAGTAIDAFTVRKQVKDHGTARRIEGCLEAGDAVVVIEDVITTGRSALDAVVAAREEGANVLGVLAVIDRQEGGREAIEAAGLTVAALVTARDLGV
ncbi:MAG TPA: orotate phosphoribosyltransferase [Gemmatimonadales bacterium]|nr:orotate phosphoribosyltransferase [Gemmatimonadales bacterium]